MSSNIFVRMYSYWVECYTLKTFFTIVSGSCFVNISCFELWTLVFPFSSFSLFWFSKRFIQLFYQLQKRTWWQKQLFSKLLEITGQVENSETSEIFFLIFLNPSFWFCPAAKIKNSDIRKLGIIFQRFPRFPNFLSFRFATFSFSFLIFFFFVNVF